MIDWALKISYLSIYPSLVGNKFEVLQGAQYWNPSSILCTKQNNNQTLTNSAITHSISFTYTRRILRTLMHKNFSSVLTSSQIKQWKKHTCTQQQQKIQHAFTRAHTDVGIRQFKNKKKLTKRAVNMQSYLLKRFAVGSTCTLQSGVD